MSALRSPLLATGIAFAAFGLLLTAAPAVSGAEGGKTAPRSTRPAAPLVKVGDHRMLEKRYGAAAVTHGDYIYVIGGCRGQHLLASVERYDVHTGQSEPFAQLKTARRWHRAAVLGTRIYVLGGYTEMPAQNGPSETVEVIDLATGKVAPGRNLPQPCAQFGCVELGGNLYVLGGYTWKRDAVSLSSVAGQRGRGSRTNVMWILDPASDQWSAGTPMPQACETNAVVVAGGSIVVAGGYEGPRDTSANSGVLDEVAAFNPRDKLWRIQPPLHRPVSGHALVFLAQHLFLFGVYGAEEEYVAYDLKTKQSASYTEGFEGVRHPAALAVGDRLFVIGGTDSDGEGTDRIQVFTLRPR